MKRRTMVAACIPAAWGALSGLRPAGAQAAWSPDRPIRLIVPFGPGGSTDITGRVIADALSARLGQPMVVENRAGAGGSIGAEVAARAAPDGHTLLLATSTHAALPALHRNLPWHPQRDLAPVSLTAFIPNLLVVNPEVPAGTVPELIALARSRSVPLAYGTSGPGTSQHMAAALFAARAGVELTHVPYRGGGQAVVDLISNKVQLYFAPMAEVIGHVQATRLRALAVTTAQRSALFPQVPTVAEALPGYEVRLWNGIFGPAGILPAAVARLSQELATALRSPELREKLAQQGSEPVGSTPEVFAAFLAAEIPRWAELVRLSGVSSD